RPNHQALRAEAVERDVEIRLQRSRRPLSPIGLGDEPGHLGPDVRPRRERPQVARPRLDRAGANIRLPEVIEDEALRRKAIRELRRDLQMSTIYKDVVGEAELFEQREAG